MVNFNGECNISGNTYQIILANLFQPTFKGIISSSYIHPEHVNARLGVTSQNDLNLTASW